MNSPLSRIGIAVSFGIVAVVLLIASSSVESYSAQIQYEAMTLQQHRQTVQSNAGANPSYSWRNYGRVRRLLVYRSPIQHIVVIDMENRTVDNLFSGYYGQVFNNGEGKNWEQKMNIANPMGSTPLIMNPLGAPFDPHHTHGDFLNEVSCPLGNCFAQPSEGFTCLQCAPPPMGIVTGYSFVPTYETSEYAQFIQNFASADDVLQANQGPSMPSHQYLISGQSGGITGSRTAPLALADNPTSPPALEPTGNDAGPDPEEGDDITYCGGSTKVSPSLDMRLAWGEPVGNNQSPCESYVSGTILDEVASHFGFPSQLDWQYIASQQGGYWAAPTAVASLYSQWRQYPLNDPRQSFIVDKNAYNFVQNIKTGSGNPTRPFAALTYLTPCNTESDHANTSGYDVYGPEWVGTVVNAIGNSPYWSTTTIIVTWDDWGGWYDHMGWVESALNPYGPNPADPNEWGLRVPFIVISPYVISRGYVSHGPNSAPLNNPIPRSQSSILNYIEWSYFLPTLSSDDLANQHSGAIDNLTDMFNFSQNPLPFVQASVPPSYSIPNNTCATPHP